MESIKVTILILLCLPLLSVQIFGSSPDASSAEPFLITARTYFSPPSGPLVVPQKKKKTEKVKKRPEHQIKAGLLKNFLFFCSWPKNSPIPESDAIFNVGFIKKNDVYDYFQNSLKKRNKPIKKKKVKTLYISSGEYENLKKCHAVFIPKISKKEFNKIIETIGDLPILTISDHKAYHENGIIISLYVGKGRNSIVFDINHTRAKKCELSLSSKMLSHAKNVK